MFCQCKELQLSVGGCVGALFTFDSSNFTGLRLTDDLSQCETAVLALSNSFWIRSIILNKDYFTGRNQENCELQRKKQFHNCCKHVKTNLWSHIWRCGDDLKPIDTVIYDERQYLDDFITKSCNLCKIEWQRPILCPKIISAPQLWAEKESENYSKTWNIQEVFLSWIP